MTTDTRGPTQAAVEFGLYSPESAEQAATDEAGVGAFVAEEVARLTPPVLLDPCGECPKGQCDLCDGCRWAASGFGVPEPPA